MAGSTSASKYSLRTRVWSASLVLGGLGGGAGRPTPRGTRRSEGRHLDHRPGLAGVDLAGLHRAGDGERVLGRPARGQRGG